MQVLLDSLRGALGLALILAAAGAVIYFVMTVDTPPREQLEALLRG